MEDAVQDNREEEAPHKAGRGDVEDNYEGGDAFGDFELVGR